MISYCNVKRLDTPANDSGPRESSTETCHCDSSLSAPLKSPASTHPHFYGLEKDFSGGLRLQNRPRNSSKDSQEVNRAAVKPDDLRLTHRPQARRGEPTTTKKKTCLPISTYLHMCRGVCTLTINVIFKRFLGLER